MTAAVATSQTLLVVGEGREAGLDGHVIRAKKREEITVKVVPLKKRKSAQRA